MSGLSLKSKRRIWTIVFLGVLTLGAIVAEVIAGLWHPTGWTIPWTEYIARYVPWPVQLAAYVILAVWLPIHFWRHDHIRNAAFGDGFQAGLAHAEYQQQLGTVEPVDVTPSPLTAAPPRAG